MDLDGILPTSARVNAAGHLELGGCDTVALTKEFGTPLYVFCEAELRARARSYTRTLAAIYPHSTVLYATKAWANVALLRLLAEEGLGFDVVSGGELYAVKRAGAALDSVYFHGNNKSLAELREALDWGVGRIVVDSAHELDVLEALGRQRSVRPAILLRISPGVEAHTHDFLKTGILDSKFGFPLVTGQAEEVVARAARSPYVELLGLHCHIGTQIFDLEPFREAVARVLAFAGQTTRRYGYALREFSPGGGYGIRYTRADDPPDLAVAARSVAEAVRDLATQHGLPLPRLLLEPGRSIVGPAGVALYTVGARKEIPGVRTYVSVDGGMGDNIRPAIYGAQYEALVANRPEAARDEVVTIAGKYCESGDILIRDIALPRLAAGDVLAVPSSGAYCLAMASNYNLNPRPAVVLVRDGQARLIRRRETYEDMVACDVV